MTNKTLMIIAGLGLSCATLAGCVSEGGSSYETGQPSVYRERVVIERRDDRPRRMPDYDRRDGRDGDRDGMNRDRDNGRNDRRDSDRTRNVRDDRDDRRESRKCVGPNCVELRDGLRSDDNRRPDRRTSID